MSQLKSTQVNPSAPTNLQEEAHSDSKVKIRWDPPRKHSENVLYYLVVTRKCKLENFHSSETLQERKTLGLSTVISGLKSWTDYSFSVTAISRDKKNPKGGTAYLQQATRMRDSSRIAAQVFSAIPTLGMAPLVIESEWKNHRGIVETDEEYSSGCEDASSDHEEYFTQDVSEYVVVQEAASKAPGDEESVVKPRAASEHKHGTSKPNYRELKAKSQPISEVHLLRAEIEDLNTRLKTMISRAQIAEKRVTSLETQWVLDRGEIEMTEMVLGGGGWGVVKVATFRGIKVAAKSLHEVICSSYYRQLFIREMNMAAQLRHPNLVQFIGATLEREMIIITELMNTSLRAKLEQRGLPREHTVSISVQVCQALSYLHLMQPDPVIHRDLSSANVLLNPLPDNCWLAKITDYGSVNTLKALNTENPGNPVYAAPEARSSSQQSTKMDIFSLGVLLIEMVTGQFPSECERLLYTIEDRQLSDIIKQCIHASKDDRPTAFELITELSQI